MSKSRYHQLNKYIEQEDMLEKKISDDPQQADRKTLDQCTQEELDDIEHFYQEYDKLLSKRKILKVLLDNKWDIDQEQKIYEDLDEALAIQQSEDDMKKQQQKLETDIKKDKENSKKQEQEQKQQNNQNNTKNKQPEIISKLDRRQSEISNCTNKSNKQDKPKRKQSGMLELEEEFKQSPSLQLSKKISSDILQNFIKNEDFNIKNRNTNLYNQPYPIQSHQILDKCEQQKSLSQFNMVIVGHVDSGKSTLIGHLLYLMKVLGKHQMDKYQKQSKDQHKESFKYAWAQDERLDERARGVTIDLSFKILQTASKTITILDCPGHQDFVPKMISGACQAEYAILVVDSGINSFEGGFMKGGQTKEHAWLVKALGASQVIVALNKMDLVNWDEKRYNHIQHLMLDYLIQIGFDENQISFIPICAFQGINLSLPMENHQWYKGDCLLQKIENLPLPKRDIDKPVRFNIYSLYPNNKENRKGIILTGKVEGGSIQVKDKLVIMPHGIVVGVSQIFKENAKIDQIHIGDNAEIIVQMKNIHEEQLIRSGDVLSCLKYTIPISKKIVIEFVAFEITTPITKGMCGLLVYINTSSAEGRIKKINKLIDKKNGQILKKNPQTIKANECAEIELALDSLVCCEIFSNFKVYGRVILREGALTLGVGMITQIL